MSATTWVIINVLFRPKYPDAIPLIIVPAIEPTNEMLPVKLIGYINEKLSIFHCVLISYDINIHVRFSLPNHVSSSGVMWMELDDSFNLDIIDPIKAAKIPNECRLAAKAMYT